MLRARTVSLLFARSMSSGKRIVVVGGVAGGMSAAARARRLDEKASITIFEKVVFGFQMQGGGFILSFSTCRDQIPLLPTVVCRIFSVEKLRTGRLLVFRPQHPSRTGSIWTSALNQVGPFEWTGTQYSLALKVYVYRGYQNRQGCEVSHCTGSWNGQGIPASVRPFDLVPRRHALQAAHRR
jgi:hypothetical protein